MAVTISSTISVQRQNNLDNPGTLTMSHTVPTDTGVILLTINFGDQRDTTDLSVITWNGTTMDLVTEQTIGGFGNVTCMAIYKATNDLSGTHDFVMTLNGTGRFALTGYNIINGDASSPVSEIQKDSTAADRLVISSAFGPGLMLAVVGKSSTLTGIDSLSGQTPQDGRAAGAGDSDNTGYSGNASAGAASKLVISGTSTIGFVWYLAGGSFNWNQIAFILNEGVTAFTYIADTTEGILFSGNNVNISVNIPPTPNPEDTVVEFNPFSAAFRGTPRTHKLIVWTNVRS